MPLKKGSVLERAGVCAARFVERCLPKQMETVGSYDFESVSRGNIVALPLRELENSLRILEQSFCGSCSDQSEDPRHVPHRQQLCPTAAGVSVHFRCVEQYEGAALERPCRDDDDNPRSDEGEAARCLHHDRTLRVGRKIVLPRRRSQSVD